jgi:hypothetical protein
MPPVTGRSSFRQKLCARSTRLDGALLDDWITNIDGTTVTYKGYDMLTGVFPYNVQITADGTLALVNHNGNVGACADIVDLLLLGNDVHPRCRYPGNRQPI